MGNFCDRNCSPQAGFLLFWGPRLEESQLHSFREEDERGDMLKSA